MPAKTEEEILKLVKKEDVSFIKLWFSDILGQLKSVAIPVGELETAFSEGMGFDGSSIKGFARIDESDMLASPDPNTFAILPWISKQKVARMFCDIIQPEFPDVSRLQNKSIPVPVRDKKYSLPF